MRMQSGLGAVQGTGRADVNNGGVISLAKVVKVYNDTHRADVVLSTNDFLGDNEETDGKIACIQLEDYAGWNDEYKSYYGTSTPLIEGQLVIIAYIDAMKAQAVILKAFPPHINEYTLFPKTKTNKMDKLGEVYEKINVAPDQSYTYSNAYGEFEKVSSSRAFFVGMKNKLSDARNTDFNYQNLTLKHKFRKDTIGLKEEELNFSPFNFLAVTKNKFKDLGATFNRFFHDAEKGITRFTKDDDNKVFYIQLGEDNKFEIRSNLDTNKRDFEVEPTGDETLRVTDSDIWNSPKENKVGAPAKDYARIEIQKDGTILIERVNKNSNSKSSVTLTDKDLKVENIKNGSKSIVVLDGGNITIKADTHIKLDAPRIDLN